MINQPEKISNYAWYALALLTLVYVLNFLDRVLILYLFTPIKAEFAFTDLQLALRKFPARICADSASPFTFSPSISPLIGKLNDYLGGGENPAMMRYGLLVCPLSCLLSALMLYLGSRSLDKSEN